MALTDTAIRNAKPGPKAQRIWDSGGLYLEVSPAGGKLWRYKYYIDGKEKRIALGAYPDIGLREARSKRDEAYKLRKEGVDPSAQRKRAKRAQATAPTDTLEAVARHWFSLRSPGWVPGHSSKIINRLERDIFPWIGSIPIRMVSRADILNTLKRIADRGSIESAARAGANLAQIFTYAIDNELADRNPAERIRSALPSRTIKHRAAITEVRMVAGLLRAIETYSGSHITKSALRLAPLVFVRPIELRSAMWADIDLDQAIWSIPAEKMKMREPHIVPLSRQSLAILRDIQPLTGSGTYVFPGAHNPKRPMSNNAVLSALRRMGFEKDEMTGHGFRAMARTILDETLKVRVDYIEHQLAHTVKDPNGRAYNRTKHLDERRVMMQQWADYLDGLKSEAIS